MVELIRNTRIKEVLENVRGGIGKVEIHKKIMKEDGVPGLDLFAKVIVYPYATIGYHLHVDDAEAYYVVKGSGIFLNAAGEKVPVGAGDICLIERGQSHGMENPTAEPLEMIAIVY